MVGKKVLVTVGGWEDHYAARGINGPRKDILFPIDYGVLFYPGFTVLKPFVEYRVDRTRKEEFREMEGRLRKRLGGSNMRSLPHIVDRIMVIIISHLCC